MSKRNGINCIMISFSPVGAQKHSSLDSLENVLSGSNSNIRSILLNKCLSNNTSLYDKSVPLGPVAAQQSGSVKVLTNSLGECTSVIGQEVDVSGGAATKLLLPSINGELIIDGNNVDVLDSLGLEFGGVLDVAWNLG